MANDNRPFALVDVGYFSNPKWFEVERFLLDDAKRNATSNATSNASSNATSNASSNATSNADASCAASVAVRDAREAHLCSILYCSRNFTDGRFPISYVMRESTVTNPAVPDALFAAGLWEDEDNGMASVHDFLEHQSSADERGQRSEKARKAARARWGKNATSNASSNATSNASSNASSNATSNAEKSREEKSRDIKPPTPLTENFTAFWDAFPPERKINKQGCAKKFADAIKAGTPASEIIAAAARYRDDPNREPKYTVNPYTWLREGRWESGPLPPRQATTYTRSQQAAAEDFARLTQHAKQTQLAIESAHHEHS